MIIIVSSAIAPVAFSVSVKDELARAGTGRVCCRRTEAAMMLRLTASVHRLGGRLELSVRLEHGPAAQRLAAAITEVHGHSATAAACPSRPGQPDRHGWQVRVPDAAELARQVGLLCGGGYPARDLARRIVHGPACEAAAAWRGALLAAGALSPPTAPPVLHLAHPGHQIALAVALVAAARRLGAAAGTRTVRGCEQVAVTDPTAIIALLTRLGAPATARAWQDGRLRLDRPARVAGFAAGDTARAGAAARASAERTAAALDVLSADITAGTVPAHVLAAAGLRLAHPSASLAELAALADPPLSKDTLAGRLRRLHSRAERAQRGVQL